MNINSLSHSILLGVAIGDALGVPVEFNSRAQLKTNPVTGFRAFGTYYQPKGTWSDDSSLTFCLAESLVKGYDPGNIAATMLSWVNENRWTPHGEVFDIGITTQQSLRMLQNMLENSNPQSFQSLQSTEDKDLDKNGNGSLMRILPLLLYIRTMPIEEQFRRIFEVSALTHPHIIAAYSCLIYLRFAGHLLHTTSKQEAYQNMQQDVQAFFSSTAASEYHTRFFDRIVKNNIVELSENLVKSSGYVIDTLEASLWCFLTGNSYSECTLKAVNLGGDTDTIGAITGGLAGIYYTAADIPESWLNDLVKVNEIVELAEKLKEVYE